MARQTSMLKNSRLIPGFTETSLERAPCILYIEGLGQSMIPKISLQRQTSIFEKSWIIPGFTETSLEGAPGILYIKRDLISRWLRRYHRKDKPLYSRSPGRFQGWQKYPNAFVGLNARSCSAIMVLKKRKDKRDILSFTTTNTHQGRSQLSPNSLNNLLNKQTRKLTINTIKELKGKPNSKTKVRARWSRQDKIYTSAISGISNGHIFGNLR